MDILDEKLIFMVESLPHLYDKKLPGYKDKKMRENAWTSIGQRLKIPAADAERRWKSIRDRFARIKRAKNMIPSGSSSVEGSQETWNLYTSLQFLVPHVHTRKSIGNIADDSMQRSIFENDKDCENVDPRDAEDEIEYIDEDILEYLNSTHQSNSTKLANSQPNHPRQKGLKRKAEKLEDQVVSALNNMNKALSETSTSMKDDVEWNFCVSLYGSLKKMDKRRRKKFRFQISQMLYDLESESD